MWRSNYICTKLSKYLLVLFLLIYPIHSDNASSDIQEISLFSEIYRMQIETLQGRMLIPEHSILGTIIAQKKEPIGHTGNGYCTGLIRYYRELPWNGNANTWLQNALDAGFLTGDVPRVNAIMVENSKPFGHVAYVLEVEEDSFTIIEQNVMGFGVISKRVLPIDYEVSSFIY